MRGCCPDIITQSDPGHENNGVANAQTVIHQTLDPSLAGTMQHCFTKGHNNILSDIKWSVFRRDFSPGFENILEEGVQKGWYDVDNTIEKYVLSPVSIDNTDNYLCAVCYSIGWPSHGFKLRLTSGFGSKTRHPHVPTRTKFFPMEYQCSSERSHIGMVVLILR